MRIVWSLISSVASVMGGLVAMALVLPLYRYIWEDRTWSPITWGGGYQLTGLSGWDRILFHVMFWCLALGTAAGAIVFSAWLARRLGGSTRVAVACTVLLIGLVGLPFISLVSAVFFCNWGAPFPTHCD